LYLLLLNVCVLSQTNITNIVRFRWSSYLTWYVVNFC